MDCVTYNFILQKKSTFLISKGLFNYMINKYNTWLLAGLELLFSCSNHTRRNTIYNSLYIFIMAEFVLKPQRKIPKKLPYSTNFNASSWLDRSRIGFHTACWPIMGIIILSLGGKKQCTISLQIWYKNQIYVSLSLKVRWRTFPSNLKALKTNVIFCMAKQE